MKAINLDDIISSAEKITPVIFPNEDESTYLFLQHSVERALLSVADDHGYIVQ